MREDLVASPGLEPGLFALRGRRVNQLHHDAMPNAMRSGSDVFIIQAEASEDCPQGLKPGFFSLLIPRLKPWA